MRKRLARYNLPEPVLRSWEKRYNNQLLPLQYRAIEEYGLLDGQSLLISAPTSSGKTFCGELAIIRAVIKRQKAIFLTPLKAVTEEKFRQFSQCYGDLGLRVVVGTRDHPEYDADIENGRFDVAVMVYEKFNSLLLTNFDLMAQVGALVIDELQMMEDESRGASLELALTKLLYAEYQPQLVALSAVLGEASGLAEWLGCRLLLEKSRPVELRRGVATDGMFHYRCHNTGEIGQEAIAGGEDNSASLFENLKSVFTIDESGQSVITQQVLVFLKSRPETMSAAHRFIEYAGLMPREVNRQFWDERFIDEDESSLLENLKSLFACGVAFHNADLRVAQRTAVEDGYRAGLIGVVFATTTLSTGINLPAATVFIEAQKYRHQEYSGRAGLEPLSWPEYESMSGRAGRVGWVGTERQLEAGRAILFAGGELEKSILWEFYIDRRPEPMKSRLCNRDLVDTINDLFCSGLATNHDDICRLLARSYYCYLNAGSLKIPDGIYARLVKGGFLIQNGDEFLSTPLGKAASISGLSVSGAEYIVRTGERSGQKSDMQLVSRLFHSPEGRSIYIPPGRRGLSGSHCFPGDINDNLLIQEITALRRELTADETSRLRLTFLVFDWMAGMSVLEIENKYHLYPGMMENIGCQIRWLLSSAAAVIRAADRYSILPGRLGKLAFSAGPGLPFEFKDIYDELGDVLSRREILGLPRENIVSLEEALKASSSAWSKLVLSDERRRKISEKIGELKEGKMHSCLIQSTDFAGMMPTIEIEGTPVRERFLIRINGRSISLTLKSFKYLVSLAWSRLTKDHGWLYKEELEQGFNQARYLYRLRQEIGRDFLPDWPLYENNRSGYYRLVTERDKIKINVAALNENPDYEIRRMAADLTPPIAC